MYPVPLNYLDTLTPYLLVLYFHKFDPAIIGFWQHYSSCLAWSKIWVWGLFLIYPVLFFSFPFSFPFSERWLGMTEILLRDLLNLQLIHDARWQVIRRLGVWSLPGWQHSFVEIGSCNIFYCHSLPCTDSRMAISGKRMCTILVNHLRGLSLPSKSVVT